MWHYVGILQGQRNRFAGVHVQFALRELQSGGRLNANGTTGDSLLPFYRHRPNGWVILRGKRYFGNGLIAGELCERIPELMDREKDIAREWR